MVDAAYGDAWEQLAAEGCDFALVAKAPSAEWVRRLRALAPFPVRRAVPACPLRASLLPTKRFARVDISIVIVNCA